MGQNAFGIRKKSYKTKFKCPEYKLENCNMLYWKNYTSNSAMLEKNNATYYIRNF